ncbi:MAG: protein kinase domain-containing protein [Gemmatimonadaceae bacterium]
MTIAGKDDALVSDLISGLAADLAGQYTVGREFGRGGMATVFLAHDLKHDRDVAIKVLHPDLAAAMGADRFRREIRIATRLTHPHILPVYDSGEAAGSLYFVMPFVEGESLRQKLAREHQLPVEEAVRITCEVAGALDYAHRHDVIHRDVKPENILLEDGHAIVADFGIARAVRESSGDRLTQSGVTLGTPTYMSPEQATAEREIDGRSDTYSLACVLYEMLAGQPPFTGPNAQAIIARHTLDDVPPLTTVRGTISAEMEDAVMRALAKVPADRFASVASFATALCDADTTTPTYRSTARRSTGRRRRSPRMRRIDVAAIIGVPLLAAAAGAWWLRSSPTRETAAGILGLSYQPNRVAVLYFDDESAAGQLGYLADGLTETLIDKLGEVRPLDVVSTDGVEPFRHAAASMDSVAEALQAGTLVRGAVEAIGDRVRVTVRLVDGNSGADFRRASFEQPKGNFLAVRDTLAEQVARFLRERLGEEITLSRDRAETTSADAWSLVQRAGRAIKDARALNAADSAEQAARRVALADSLLATAETVDPLWPAPVLARAGLKVRQTRGAPDDLKRAELIRIGLGHAERALAIDPENAEAIEWRGTLLYYRHYYGLAPDPVEAATLLRSAEQDLRRATNIDPTRASAWNTLSLLLYRKYDRLEANVAAQRAYEADAYLRDADQILWRLYATSYDLEEISSAVKWCDLGHRRYPDDPDFVACRLWIMTSHQLPPDVDEAWRTLDEIGELVPKSAWETARLQYQMLVAVPIARAGLLDSARRVIERSRASRDVDPGGELIGQEVLVRALIGDREEAIRQLRRYLVSHPEHREGFTRANTWWWRTLQDDPRFRELVGSRG